MGGAAVWWHIAIQIQEASSVHPASQPVHAFASQANGIANNMLCVAIDASMPEGLAWHPAVLAC